MQSMLRVRENIAQDTYLYVKLILSDFVRNYGLDGVVANNDDTLDTICFWIYSK